MELRIGSQSTARNVRSDVARAALALAKVQRQLSTGRRVERPADDPYAALRGVGLRAALGRLASYARSGAEAEARLGIAEDALLQVTDQLARARELAVQGANATLSDADRRASAQEVDTLIETMLAAANSDLDGSYVFAGTGSLTAPVEALRGPDGRIASVRFNGGADRVRLRVGERLELDAGLLAEEVFGTSARQAPRYTGGTGAAPSAAATADTGTGRQALQVAHTLTHYGDGLGPGGGDSASGIAAGTSASNDTVLGAIGAHTLQLRDTSALVDGTEGVVSLNGGPEIAFTAAGATDVRVEGPDGEVVHLDLTAITAGFNGSVALGGDGTLSLDDGATASAISFAAQQTVVSSADGTRLHIDTSAVRAAGLEIVDHRGTNDLFTTLIALRDALEGEGALGVTDQLQLIGDRLADIGRVEEAATGSVGWIGARRAALQTVEARIADQRLRLDELRSRAEDVDLVSAFAEFQEREIAFQRALEVGARVIQPSIMNFLR